MRPKNAGIRRGPLITAAQVAEATGLSPRTIWSLAAQQRLTPYRFGRRATRFAAEEVEALIEAARAKGRA